MQLNVSLTVEYSLPELVHIFLGKNIVGVGQKSRQLLDRFVADLFLWILLACISHKISHSPVEARYFARGGAVCTSAMADEHKIFGGT